MTSESQAFQTRVNRYGYSAGFIITICAPIAWDLALPLKVIVVLLSVPVAISLFGFFARAGWYDRRREGLRNMVFGVGIGLVFWGLGRMAQELQEITYYLRENRPEATSMAQYVAPEGATVVHTFYADLWAVMAALAVVGLLEAAYKARLQARAIEPAPEAIGR